MPLQFDIDVARYIEKPKGIRKENIKKVHIIHFIYLVCCYELQLIYLFINPCSAFMKYYQSITTI